MPDPGLRARALTGRLAEYQLILAAIDQGPRLTVLSCVPCSGTSALLATAAQDAHRPCVLIDARSCPETLDVAMALADAAVRAFAQDAASWWFDPASPQSTHALRLARTLGNDGIDVHALRDGAGNALARLDQALGLVCALAGQPVTVIIDHLGPLLWQQGPRGARELLGQLRASLQDLPDLSLVLADGANGTAVQAMGDREHPLYRAGDVHTITRPTPQRYVDDLTTTQPTDIDGPLLRGCAELATGCPAVTWRILELSDTTQTSAAAALAGWQRLPHLAEPSVARQWDTLRRVHPLAQTVTAVIASGLRPHGVIAANDKSISDATRIMRALGVAWQPEPRGRWAIADPLLAAYSRDHAPAWIAHRNMTAAA